MEKRREKAGDSFQFEYMDWPQQAALYCPLMASLLASGWRNESGMFLIAIMSLKAKGLFKWHIVERMTEPHPNSRSQATRDSSYKPAGVFIRLWRVRVEGTIAVLNAEKGEPPQTSVKTSERYGKVWWPGLDWCQSAQTDQIFQVGRIQLRANGKVDWKVCVKALDAVTTSGGQFDRSDRQF